MDADAGANPPTDGMDRMFHAAARAALRAGRYLRSSRVEHLSVLDRDGESRRSVEVSDGRRGGHDPVVADFADRPTEVECPCQWQTCHGTADKYLDFARFDDST